MLRRRFLTWGTGGILALGAAATAGFAAVVRFLFPSVYYEPPQSFKIGTPGDFPIGTPTFLPDETIFVFRDQEKGFSVASAVCTHLGCTVQWFNNDSSFHCPCHGSVFANDGKVVSGPAPRPLDWLEVTQTHDGQLRVDKSRVVPASYRLIVKT
jgi:cytochrome b6-f complex iron-sulfur subunit